LCLHIPKSLHQPFVGLLFLHQILPHVYIATAFVQVMLRETCRKIAPDVVKRRLDATDFFGELTAVAKQLVNFFNGFRLHQLATL
jgi:hypothetical protein